MVLMNLFAGKEWRCRYRVWTCGHSRGRRAWDEWRSKIDTQTHTHIYIHIMCKIDNW